MIFILSIFMILGELKFALSETLIAGRSNDGNWQLYRASEHLTPRLGHSSHSSHSIPYYSKPFHFLNSTNHSISFHFFSTFFFNFPNPYTISLNLNHLYHLEIHRVKPFNIFFFSNHSKPFSNHFAHPKEWNGMGKMVCPNKPWIFFFSL